MNCPHEVELALWFHDAVYKPFAKDNEQASATWAARFLGEQGATEDSIQRVYNLIMITEHNAKPLTRDQAVLVDIDLSILASPREIFDQFECHVRQEYKKVPWFIYRRKRQQLLKEFLAREQLYTSGCFNSEMQLQAQVNLNRAIAQLDARSERTLFAPKAP
jgi:predicted metal-dependent HD superfamily phosphohydrolase